MKIVKYYQVTNNQLFLMAILVAVIVAALITINTAVKEYLQLPEVIMTAEDKCATVSNFKNGDAYTCGDVGTILRNFRTKKN
jgi:hypothetical protein